MLTESNAEHFIPTADGLKVFVRDYRPLERARLPVLCLHGLTRNSRDFEIVAPRIAALGRRVLAADMRGRGRSDYDPEWRRYHAATYVSDVLNILDALSIEKAVFVGTSMGGIITMMMAGLAASRIGAAILNDIGPVIDPKGVARIAGYVGKGPPAKGWADMIALIRDAQGPLFPGRDASFWETFARRVARELPSGEVAFDYDPAIANAFADPATAAPPDLKPMFASLAAAPVLVLRGATSDILSPEGVAAMRELKADLETVEIPGIGHAPTLEEPKAETAIRDFLSRAP